MGSQQIIVATSQHLIYRGLEKVLQANGHTLEILNKTDRQGVFGVLEEYHDAILFLDFHLLKDFQLDDIRKILLIIPAHKFICILSTLEKLEIKKILELGVKSIITKNCSEREIINVVDAANQKESFVCSKVLDIVMSNDVEETVTTYEGGLLSQREIEILKQISSGKSTIEIADTLFLSPHTIHAYRKTILKKLNVKTPVELVCKAIRQGII